MELPLYQVDAFTTQLFAGNPAAVCPLDAWLPDALMQKIALENNLSETAFFVPEKDGYHIRWFTPQVEVDLCGHATLASAHVLMEHLEPSLQQVRFTSRSGELRVERDGERKVLDFPAQPPEPCELPAGLADALGGAPGEVLRGPYLLARFENEAALRALRPDFRKLHPHGYVITTAPGDEVDFVSRFFCPAAGIDEDPVTGSAHCILTPYWAKQLGKRELRARQVSARGGELECALDGDRVRLAGHARTYLTGSIVTE